MTETTSNVRDWLHAAGQKLAGMSETPNLEAQMILAQAVQRPRTWLAAHPDAEVMPEQACAADGMLERARTGEPLPYILGHQEFYGLDLVVSPDVLIPRPETELLVQAALDWLRRHPDKNRIADVGTGSGCIALSLAHHLPDVRVVGLEISDRALAIARLNTERLGLAGRVSLVQSDLLEGLAERVDVVCANLPYIPTLVLEGLPVSRCEPRLALDGGDDGLRLIERLLDQIARIQNSLSMVLLEIEANQGWSAKALADKFFPAASISISRDWGGHDRLLAIEIR